MKPKTRKLLSRLGAVLMLGMSLFNFGHALRKGPSELRQKRAKHIRIKEKEQEDTEQAQIASVAEEEAMAVLAEVSVAEKESQREAATEQTTTLQRIARYSAVGVWATSATIFFTSMIFNQPFALGKGVLSLLPGNPHVAVFKVGVEKKYFEVGDQIKADVSLHSNGEPAGYAKVTFDYDPEVLRFDNYELTQYFDGLDERKLDEESGQLILFLKRTKGEMIFEGEKFLAVNFTAMGESRKQPLEVNQDESLVLQSKDQTYNILGKVTADNFLIIPTQQMLAECEQIRGMDGLRRITKATLLPGQKSNWVSMDEGRAMVCAYQNNQLYLVLTGYNQQELTIKINNKKFDGQTVKQWQDGGQQFVAFSFDVANVTKNAEIDRTKIDNWPKEGYLKIKLK